LRWPLPIVVIAADASIRYGYSSWLGCATVAGFAEPA
jgi:hypothetical protein